MKASLELLNKVEEKFEAIKQEYYKIIEEGNYAETEEHLLQPDADIHKLEISLKSYIHKNYEEKIIKLTARQRQNCIILTVTARTMLA